MKIIDPEKGEGKLTEHLTGVKSVLIVFWHGVGDVVMFKAPLARLRELYPDVIFTAGLARGLQEEAIIPDAVLLEGSWREDVQKMDYDLVFLCHFPAEDLGDLTRTKAEICCERELGIEPTWGHAPLEKKPLIGIHFQNTSVDWLANPDEATAAAIWQDILDAGCVPIEVHFEHAFHNPKNARFPFVDTHVRGMAARLDTMIALVSRLDAFVGVVSGPFHTALSVLGHENVLLLEKELKVEHFTKEPLARANVKDYQGEVRTWLENMKRSSARLKTLQISYVDHEVTIKGNVGDPLAVLLLEVAKNKLVNRY